MRQLSSDQKFPVKTVDLSWSSDIEALGTKRKFWYRENGESAECLFKYPQPDTGQHWAEKVAAEIADHLGTLHAKVDLAVVGDDRGTSSPSFASEGRELFHGNQIMAGAFDEYDPGLRFHQSGHTFANILVALEKMFLETRGLWAKRLMAQYTVLDALIGNTDRHHENWGLLRRRSGKQWKGNLAPTFDHASSLGRELKDTGPGRTRERLLADNAIGAYSERGRGGIFWISSGRHGPSPLALVRLASEQYPELYQAALLSLQRVDRDSLSKILDRVPNDWMTPLSRVFALELLCYNLCQLKALIR